MISFSKFKKSLKRGLEIYMDYGTEDECLLTVVYNSPKYKYFDVFDWARGILVNIPYEMFDLSRCTILGDEYGLF